MIALGVVNVLLATVFVATPAAAADARVFIESSMDGCLCRLKRIMSIIVVIFN